MWGLEVRAWDPGPRTWSAAGPRLELEGAARPTVAGATIDASGRVLVAVLSDDGPSGVYRLQDGAWLALEEGARRLAAIAATDGGGVVGAGTSGDDGRIFLGSDTRWSPLGFPLDAEPWSAVDDVTVLASEGEFYAAWVEGPTDGNRVLYVARWNEDGATWERLGGGPADAVVDHRAARPSLSLDESGHLWVLYTEDAGEGDDPFVQRVLRSREPVR
jgi:hypothetical protein